MIFFSFETLDLGQSEYFVEESCFSLGIAIEVSIKLAKHSKNHYFVSNVEVVMKSIPIREDFFSICWLLLKMLKMYISRW